MIEVRPVSVSNDIDQGNGDVSEDSDDDDDDDDDEMVVVLVITRFPFNLRPTTHKCVHLVTCGHFRSRDKDGGRTNRSVIVKKLTLHAKLVALCFCRSGVVADHVVLQLREDAFSTFFVPVTLTLT